MGRHSGTAGGCEGLREGAPGVHGSDELRGLTASVVPKAALRSAE